MKNLPPQQVNSWPEARMQELVHCYNVRHMSNGECAKHFDVTRNVIVGKINRNRTKYGFERRVEGMNQHRAKKQPKESKIKPRPQAYNNKKCKLSDTNNTKIVVASVNGLTESVRNNKFVEPAWEKANTNNRNIWQLEPHNCVWPVSGQGADTVYCGANKTTQSYCTGHSIKAYRNFA